MRNNFFTMLTGFLMAFADSVPGVSGGTIAYILGKYDELINSINVLMSKATILEKKKSVIFLIKLAIGWIVGFVIAVFIITNLMHEHTYEMTSLFLGFIVFSIPFIILEEQQILKNKHLDKGFIIVGSTIVIAISYFSSSNLSLLSSNLTLISYIYIFIAGAIAISAMLLPGISGSTLLIIFGLYSTIMNSIKTTLKFDFSNILIVLIFGLGILFGLKFTSKIISKALHSYRSKVVYLIIGLMLGSIYSLIIGPTTLVNEATNINLGLEKLSFNSFSIIFFIVGVAIIYGLDKLKHFIQNNK
ncbi:MAG: DUF368 domain-containing protein [Bacilli bacterium]